MIKIICTVFSLLLLAAMVNAGSNNARHFTEQDLKKYKGNTETQKSEIADSDAYNSLNTDSPTQGEALKQLKRYVIPYNPYEGSARRIIIPVTFNNRITAPMLLDTGAPGMQISYSLAEKLGILEDEDGKLSIMVSGVGGAAPALLTIIDEISVGQAKSHFVPTIISRPISLSFEGLVGMDFMAKYSVQIDTKRHVLYLDELPDSPDTPAGHDEEWWRLNFHNFKSLRHNLQQYRDRLYSLNNDSGKIKKLREFADRQYDEANSMLDRLRVYASENSVPLQWR